MRLAEALVLVLVAAAPAACSDFVIAPTKPDVVVPTDTDVALPLDTDPPKTHHPRHPRDTDPDPAEPIESDTPPPVDTAPTGPIDPPVADAGADRQIDPLKTVTLNGTGSYDPGGRTPLTYRWTTTSRPSGSTAVLLNRSKARPSIWIDVAGTYELKLEVRNAAGVWDPTPDTMTIEALPSDDFYVQLTWSSSADLDLHTLRDGMSLFDRGDCAFCNKNPSWYQQGIADDPSLDWDVIDGYGPETTTVDTPGPEHYRIEVHYYGVGGNTTCGGPCPSSVATLQFYFQGGLVDTMTRTLNTQGQVWEAATFDGATGTVTHTDTVGTSSRTSCQ